MLGGVALGGDELKPILYKMLIGLTGSVLEDKETHTSNQPSHHVQRIRPLGLNPWEGETWRL